MIRVAYLLLWFPEPSQTFVLEEVNTLIRLGLEVSVYTLYGPRPPARLAGLARPLAPVQYLGLPSLPALLRERVHLSRTFGRQAAAFWRRVLWRPWRSLETAGEALWAALAGVHLARLLPAAGIHHIHAPWADGPATAAWVASQLSGIPFSFGARAHDLHPADGALAEKIAAAAFVRTNTLSNREFLTRFAPTAPEKIINIYNGVSFAPTAGSPRPPQPPLQLLALGRLVPKKGFAVLLRACGILRDQGLDFRLTLGGDGPERHRLQALVTSLDLTSRVHLPGHVPHREVPQLFAATDLFVMPSLITPSGDRDGIPNVVLEALTHEVPVVASNVSGLPEVVQDGKTGWLVPPEDPEALARAITAALSDPSAARHRARQGRELVRREFDSRKNYLRLKGLFEENHRSGRKIRDHQDPIKL